MPWRALKGSFVWPGRCIADGQRPTAAKAVPATRTTLTDVRRPYLQENLLQRAAIGDVDGGGVPRADDHGLHVPRGQRVRRRADQSARAHWESARVRAHPPRP